MKNKRSLLIIIILFIAIVVFILLPGIRPLGTYISKDGSKFIVEKYPDGSEMYNLKTESELSDSMGVIRDMDYLGRYQLVYLIGTRFAVLRPFMLGEILYISNGRHSLYLRRLW